MADLEIWKAVRNYEGLYEVSNIGSVRSIDRTVVRRDGKIKRFRGQPIKTRLSFGYPVVTISKQGVLRTYSVALLVLEAFRGSRPNGYEVCHHPDPNRTNCRLDNLRFDTHAENMKDKVRLGVRYNRGFSNGMARMTPRVLKQIRSLRRRGIQVKIIAQKIGMGVGTVSSVLNGRRWKDTP